MSNQVENSQPRIEVAGSGSETSYQLQTGNAPEPKAERVDGCYCKMVSQNEFKAKDLARDEESSKYGGKSRGAAVPSTHSALSRLTPKPDKSGAEAETERLDFRLVTVPPGKPTAANTAFIVRGCWEYTGRHNDYSAKRFNDTITEMME
ncbi:hypothetical protein NUW58_g3151 [Xylaria curta]|uniref:Uncharacterized protein n=1 Tax=Xylaria curta TaxID=42375 RepID=A0ACC1PDZ7_9PEZI|nr:hypothetical protein NUW58_g3151 [Xylaria curta]